MGQLQLCQQGSCQIGLVAEFRDLPRCLDSTTCPHHRNLVACLHGFGIRPVVDAVVWQEDDEQVVPLRQLLQLVDEVADAGVEVVEGVGYLLVESLQRYVPGLV